MSSHDSDLQERALAWSRREQRRHHNKFVEMLSDENGHLVDPQGYLALKRLEKQISPPKPDVENEIDELEDVHDSWLEATKALEEAGEYEYKGTTYYRSDRELLEAKRWRWWKTVETAKVRWQMLKDVLRNWEIFGRLTTYDESKFPLRYSGDQQSEGIGHLTSRDVEYLAAIHALIGMSFNSAHSYFKKIAEKAIKEDGTSPSPQAVRDWLERTGRMEKGQKLSGFRKQLERAATALRDEGAFR